MKVRDMVVSGVRAVLRKADIDVRRYRRTLPAMRSRILKRMGVNVVLDVGANKGQYAQELRATGFKGRIVSFEPLPDASARLRKAAATDAKWDVRETALGDFDGQIDLHVSGNSVSSSVLPMLDAHASAAPQSRYTGTCTVNVARLDSLANKGLIGDDDRVYLKLDVQGFELAVLKGAISILHRVTVIESELSLVPLYEGQKLMDETMRWLAAARFKPVFLENGFYDPGSGDLLQVDGLFIRESFEDHREGLTEHELWNGLISRR